MIKYKYKYSAYWKMRKATIKRQSFLIHNGNRKERTTMNKLLQLAAAVGITIAAFFLGVTKSSREIVPDGYIKLEECIPLEDISCWFINEYGYPCFELKDYGNQLDDPDNRSYQDIMDSFGNGKE